MKKSIFLLAILSLLLLPALNVFAGQRVVTEINPILTGGERRVTVQEIPDGGGEFAACDETAHDYDSFKLAVLRRLRQKDTDFTICFQAGYQPSEGALTMLDKINQDQEVPWLSNSWYKAGAYSGATQFTYQFTYWHNQAQEAELETAVREQVRQLVSSGMDMPTREKTIHDWIVKHVSYDTQTYQKYSDYDAFFDRSAVCQGYALLTDRMLAMAGVEDKIVIGKAGGGDHAWNMVKLCGNWFHLDTTWDDPVGMGPDYIRWDYFNVTDSVLGIDHSWNWNDYPACNSTYYDGYCQGEVVNGCSIFAPQNCQTELQCMNASGTWSNGACSVPGSNPGGGGDKAELAAPEQAMAAVTYGSVTPVFPEWNLIAVNSGPVLLQPKLKVPGSDLGKPATLFIYIYLPDSKSGINFPGLSVTLGNEVSFEPVFPRSIDLSNQSNFVFDVYCGYVLADGTIRYNAYEVWVDVIMLL